MRFCRPAMAAQRAPHQWLLLLDAGTPESFRRRVEECSDITPVYLEPPHTVERAAAAVAEHADVDGASHLLTTRLDSDDAIANDYLATVQRRCRMRDRPEFLNVPVGYQWLDGRLYASCDLSNPFLSYIEPLGEEAPRTVFRMAHIWARRVAPVRQIWTGPKWIQVLHGANDASHLDGVRRLHTSTPRGFRGQPGFAHVDPTDRVRDFLRTFPAYLGRQRRLPRQILGSMLRPGHIESYEPDPPPPVAV